MSKVNLWVGIPFLLFGLVFAGIGGWFYWGSAQLAETGARAQGIVVDLEWRRDSDGDSTYRPVVEFTDQSGTRHQFVESIGSSPPAFSRGEEVEVIYDPWAPDEAIIDSFTTRYLFPLAFGGFGSLFALVGSGLMFAWFRRRAVISDLKESGLRIQAKFTRCYLDTGTRINGRSPYRVTAQAMHPATGKLASFNSDAIWLDLSDVLKGKSVPVIVDPEDPDDHYVDLSEWVHESEEA